jgi:hypothetical protein
MTAELDPRVIRRLADWHAVYRMWDAEGKLLYVGKSGRAGHRFDTHSTKRWFPLVVMITLEWHETEAQAVLAERRAIATGNPRYNIAGARAPHIMPPAKVRPQLIEDILTILEPGEQRQHSSVVCERLAGLRADYQAWDATRLGRALARHGVQTRQLWLGGSNRQGVTRKDLRANGVAVRS